MKNQPEIIWAIVAMIGGVTRILSEYVKADDYIWEPKKVVANLFISGFVGFTVGTFVFEYQPSIVLGVCGMSGYAGIKSLDYLIHRIKVKTNGK